MRLAASEVYASLLERGVTLTVEGHRLRYEGGTLTVAEKRAVMQARAGLFALVAHLQRCSICDLARARLSRSDTGECLCDTCEVFAVERLR